MRGNQGNSGPTSTVIANTNRLSATDKNIVDAATTGAQDTIYLCNFRVSVDGDWLCLKELTEESNNSATAAINTDGVENHSGGGNNHDQYDAKCDEKIVERDWVNYYCRCFLFHNFLFSFEYSYTSFSSFDQT